MSIGASLQYMKLTKTTRPKLTLIRCSQGDSQLRRPSVATPPVKLVASPLPEMVAAAVVVVGGEKSGVTMEYQRQRAKEMQQYFKKKKKSELSSQGPFFGFLAKNEISNGRWAMFGFAVGMLTEYATGSDFVDQVKILLSNFGILDLE